MSIRSKLLGTVLLATALWALVAAPVSATSMSGAVGVTGQGEITGRIGLVSDWSKRWWESDRGYLTGYWDGAYTYWEGSKASGAHSLSFSPVLVYQFNGRLRPFVEFGIGVSLFSKTDVGERELGSAFHFEDRLGVGLLLPNGGRLGLRAVHYSNAGIKEPNMGIESYSLFYTESF